MIRLALALAAGSAALVTGCTTPAYVSPVEVTRFTGATAQQLGSGAIAVRPAPGEAPDGWDYSAFQNAVAEELRQVGYTVTPDAAQVAEVRVQRMTAQGGVVRRSPVNVGVGGSTGSYGSGVGLGVGINLGGGGRSADTVDTELEVRIRPAAGANASWEGRARFSATTNSEYADRQAAASKLADALFSGFPGRSGETIEVR